MTLNGEKTFAHESYGMVGISRVTGDVGRLFGSSLSKHHATIRLRVYRAKRHHHLSRDWYRTTSLDPIVEIELSAAQFAEFITTPNVGDGVPCTIRSIERRRMADPPADDSTEVEEIRIGFDDRMAKISGRLQALQADVAKALEAKTLTRDSRERIRSAVDSFVTEMSSNMPFALRQLHEAAERTMTAAKAEADAWLTRVIHRAGLKALGAPVPDEGARPDGLELPAHEETP